MSGKAPDVANTKYAWLEVGRAGVAKRSAAERVADFLEIYGDLDEQTAREQASRCVQCPEPQCVAGCPLTNRIPDWLALTAEGHFLEAAALLHSTSVLPEVCARLCAADRMCEGMCVLNGKAEPVSIWAIEQFLNSYAFAHEGADAPPPPPNGLRVVVVGAGPGGLACAEVLSRHGYGVTVLDWRLVPGGLLVSGSPAFRMDRSVVNRQVDRLKQRGVEFRLGVHLGSEVTCATLVRDYDAVYLGFGARKARELSIPGHESKGLVPALSFLVGEADVPGASGPLDVQGRRVVVLGGGDMAVDAARAALRAGAREVIGIYRRTRAEMPCNPAEFANALEEGVRFEFLATPTAVLADAAGQVEAVRLVRTELVNPTGEPRGEVRPLPGTEFVVPADRVLVAFGFESSALPEDSPFRHLARRADGGLEVDERFMTSLKGVFASGELVRGPSQILEVVRDARRAAEGIHEYLRPRWV